MIYNIKKQHYDELFSLVENGQLSSLDYQIEMKGTLCININGKGNENKIVEDFVSDFSEKMIKSMELEDGTIYFQIENDELLFKDVVLGTDWRKCIYGTPEIEYDALIEIINPTLEDPVRVVINSENIELSLGLEGNINSMQPNYWVEMQYFSEEQDDFVEIPLSENTKKLMINFFHNWAIPYLITGNEIEVYTLHVESSRVSCLTVQYPIDIDLVIDVNSIIRI